MNDKELDVTEPEILETAPESSGLADGMQMSVKDQLYLAENIEKLVEAQKKIRMVILKLAQPGDWIRFKSKEDSDGKAEIGFAGSMRISSTIGISFLNFTAKKETGTDERGEWYRWEYECDAMFGNKKVRTYGRAGSRDVFFGKAYGKDKVLSEVNEGNIKMAARRACMKEGVKILLGLHRQNPAELKKNGITLDDAGSYTFGSKKEDAGKEVAKATVSEEVLTRIGKVTEVKKTDGVKKATGKPYTKYFGTVAGEEFTTFSKTQGEILQQSKKDEAKVIIKYKKTRWGNDIQDVSIDDGGAE